MSSKTTLPLTRDSRVWHTTNSLPLAALKKQRQTSCQCSFVRYLILVLGTLYLSLILGCVICFNPALTEMMKVEHSPLYNASTANSTAGHPNYASWSLPLSERRFAFTNLQKSALLAGTFGACLFMIVPIGYSMQIFGAWRTQLAVGFTVSLATGLIPLAASLNFVALLIVRMVLGLSISNLFPVVGAICNAWAPQAEKAIAEEQGFQKIQRTTSASTANNSTFLAILSGYIQLAVIISMPLSGFLLKVGWPWVFFVHSALGLILTALWAFYYRDNPEEHPMLSSEELAIIRLGKGKALSEEEKPKPPYKQILSTVPIWAILCAVFGNFVIIQFANTFLPMFLVTAMHFSNEETGLLSALPLVLQFMAKWATGMVTDRLPRVADLIKVRFCNSVAFCGAAAFFLLAALFPPEAFPRWPAVLCLVLCIGILGLNSGGFTKSVVLVSVQFTPTVMAGVQGTLCATIFAGSFVIPAMTSNGGNFDEYRRVFCLYAAVLVISNLVFVMFGKATPAKWTQQNEEFKDVKIRES